MRQTIQSTPENDCGLDRKDMADKQTEQFFKAQQALPGNNICADCGQKRLFTSLVGPFL